MRKSPFFEFRGLSCAQQGAENQKNDQESKIERGENSNVISLLMRIVSDIFAEGDQAGERGDKRSRSADIDAEQEAAVVCGKTREQDCRWDIADNLTRKCAENQGILLQKCIQQLMYGVHTRKIAGKNEKAEKGEQKTVINLCKRFAVGKQEYGRNNAKPDPVGNDPKDDDDGKRKQGEIQDGFWNGELFFGRCLQGDRLFGQKETAPQNQHDGKQERRKHNAEKFAVRNVEMRIEIKVLRIAERGEHSAKVCRNVLQDEHRRHIALGPGGREHKIAERQKGQKRHVVGDEHGAEEGDAD